jgi:membrane protease YdiL (CAAX protease family)
MLRLGVAAYLVIAFGGAWLCWAIALGLGISVRSPWFQLAMLPGGFAPAIAAVIVRKWITREGFGDAGLHLHLSQWRYYAIALILPYVVVAAIIAEASLTGRGRPDLSLLPALRVLVPSGTRLPPQLPLALRLGMPFQFMIVAVIAAPLLWGEEFGWRGYLQRRWFVKRPLLAAVATGIVWGVWHFPLLLRGYDYFDSPAWGLLVFPVDAVFLSIIFAWLHNSTGSIWAPSLAHAATNAIGISLTTLLFLGTSNLLFVGYLGILSWMPLGGLAAWIGLTRRLDVSAASPESASG